MTDNEKNLKQRLANQQKEQKAQLESEVAFAAEGRLVLNNPAFQRAMTVRKGQIFDIFVKTKQDQADIREEAWRTMQNLLALENYFEQLLATGKMADQTLQSMTEE